MPQQRSPKYPSVGLEKAIDRARDIFEKERTNAATRAVIAKALGYAGLSGASAAMIGSLRQYGLLVGRGENLKLSDIALDLLHAPVDTPEYQNAVREAATLPELFAELTRHFKGGTPSDENVRYFLTKRGLSREAIDAVIRSFRETTSFVGARIGNQPEGASPAVAEADVASRPIGTPGVFARSTPANTAVSLGDSRETPSPFREQSAHIERTVLSQGVIVELCFNREPSLEDFQALADYIEFRTKRLRQEQDVS